MLKIGLTGGIGSGKSMVASVFSRLGVPIYISDAKAKELMNTNSELKQKLVDEFGENIYNRHELNRDELASIIFSEAGLLKKVNSIVHPFVRLDFENWCKAHETKDYIINESAIIFTSGLYKLMDKVICVTAPLDLRIKRVIQRDNSNAEKVKAIANKQLSDDEMVSQSDYVLINDEKQLLLPQILSIHQKLLESNK